MISSLSKDACFFFQLTDVFALIQIHSVCCFYHLLHKCFIIFDNALQCQTSFQPTYLLIFSPFYEHTEMEIALFTVIIISFLWDILQILQKQLRWAKFRKRSFVVGETQCVFCKDSLLSSSLGFFFFSGIEKRNISCQIFSFVLVRGHSDIYEVSVFMPHWY